MNNFEEVLEGFDPMITAAIRKCRIYKNHDHYRQTARIALWKAWKNYDQEQGDFEPYAYTCIKGSILDELKKESRDEERYYPEQDDLIEFYTPTSEIENTDIFEQFLSNLKKEDKQLLIDYYLEGYTFKELAKKYNQSADALRKRKKRLLDKLRKDLMEY